MYQQIISEVETRDEENNEEHIATAQALVTVYYRPRELSSRCSINEKKRKNKKPQEEKHRADSPARKALEPYKILRTNKHLDEHRLNYCQSV